MRLCLKYRQVNSNCTSQGKIILQWFCEDNEDYSRNEWCHKKIMRSTTLAMRWSTGIVYRYKKILDSKNKLMAIIINERMRWSYLYSFKCRWTVTCEYQKMNVVNYVIDNKMGIQIYFVENSGGNTHWPIAVLILNRSNEFSWKSFVAILWRNGNRSEAIELDWIKFRLTFKPPMAIVVHDNKSQ